MFPKAIPLEAVVEGHRQTLGRLVDDGGLRRQDHPGLIIANTINISIKVNAFSFFSWWWKVLVRGWPWSRWGGGSHSSAACH